MSDEVVVRGRDFTGYRIGGAIAALFLLFALGWQVFEMLDGDAAVAPEVRWSAEIFNGKAQDVPGQGSGTLASDVLVARTKLQDERLRTGPSPEATPPAEAMGEGEYLTDAPLGDGEMLTRSWAIADGDTAAMLRESARVVGISSLPYPNAEVFERPDGRDWRIGIADFATHLGALAILGFSLLLALILAFRGRVPIAKGRSGTKVRRFGFVERATHWMTALSFIGLALSGIAIAYGETLFIPLGERAMGTLGWWATWGHAIMVPAFILGIVMMAVMWTVRNLPSKLDIEWLRKGGGLFSDGGDNPPARKFNAGQKLIFWSAMLGGLVMIVSGITLMFPYFWLNLEGMTWAMLIHAIVGVLLITIFIGHIYIGTVGMQGAIEAMWGGKVDRNWAEEHHSLWLQEIERKGASAR